MRKNVLCLSRSDLSYSLLPFFKRNVSEQAKGNNRGSYYVRQYGVYSMVKRSDMTEKMDCL